MYLRSTLDFRKRGINAHIYVWIWLTWLRVCRSVYVRMLHQAGWWSGWLVLAELISQFLSWECQSSLLLLSPSKLAVSNETGRQGTVTLMGAADTGKWNPQHVCRGWRRKTSRDQEAERLREEGEEGAPNSCQRTEWQVKEGSWAAKLIQVTRDERDISAYTALAANSPALLVFVIWQAYRASPVPLRDRSPKNILCRTNAIDLLLEFINL